MKSIIESAWMQAFVARIIIIYLEFCFATMRWTTLNEAVVKPIWDNNKPVLWAMWHEVLNLAHVSWPREKISRLGVLVSNSKSGEVSLRVNQHFGYHIFRGSSAKKSQPAKQKGGAQAFRDLLRWLMNGESIALTPDGPRGPRRQMSLGTLKLAQLSGAPILLCGAATSRYITLKSWDKMRIPLPFSRAVRIWELLEIVPRDLDEEGLEAFGQMASLRLSNLNDQADAWLNDPANQHGPSPR